MSAAAMIPLSYRPPQFESPMQVQQQWQSLQNAAIQGDMAKMQLQQAQLQQRDQQLLSKSYLDAHGDMDQFFKNAQQNGVRPQTIMALQQQWDQGVRAHADALHAQTEQQMAERNANNARNSDLNAALRGTFATLDPSTGQYTWRQPTPEEMNAFLDDQLKRGNITQQSMSQFKAAHPDGQYSPHDLQAYSSFLNTLQQQDAEAQRIYERERQAKLDQSELNLRNAQIGEADTTQQIREFQRRQAERADWASQLSAAQNADQYQAIRDKMPEELKIQVPEEFDPKKTPAVVLRWGQTPEQQIQADQARANLAANEAYKQELAAAARERAEAYKEIADKRGGNGNPTPGQQGVQDRFQTREATAASNAKNAKLQRAENEFAKDLRDAQGDPAKIQAAKDRLWNAKQAAQDAYEEDMRILGNPVPHVDYSQQRSQMQGGQGQQPAAQPAVQPPARPSSPAPAPTQRPRRYNAQGDAVEFDGTKWVPVPRGQ